MQTVKNYNAYIWILSFGIISLIAFAFFFPDKERLLKNEVSFLPLLNAVLNGFTFLFLISALLFIRKRNMRRHRNLIFCAFICTSLFLFSYLFYHFTTSSTKFGDTGWIKYLYYFLLISHIILAVAVVPLALISMDRGLNMQITLHKRITRWAMPVWLYVSLTGVIIYLMIAPYY